MGELCWSMAGACLSVSLVEYISLFLIVARGDSGFPNSFALLRKIGHYVLFHGSRNNIPSLQKILVLRIRASLTGRYRAA